jgi:hypothetical protein
MRKVRYGLFTMDYNGCELISVYNAMILFGKHMQLRDIAYYHETHGSLALGAFGTNTYASIDFFTEYGITVQTAVGAASFDDVISTSMVSIITFLNGASVFEGIHTVAFTRDSDGSINVYNYYSNDSNSARKFDSLDDLLHQNGTVIALLGLNR